MIILLFACWNRFCFGYCNIYIYIAGEQHFAEHILASSPSIQLRKRYIEEMAAYKAGLVWWFHCNDLQWLWNQALKGTSKRQDGVVETCVKLAVKMKVLGDHRLWSSNKRWWLRRPLMSFGLRDFMVPSRGDHCNLYTTIRKSSRKLSLVGESNLNLPVNYFLLGIV